MKSNEVADESYSINGFKHFSDLAVAYFPQMASTSSASKKMRNCIKASNALSEQLADAYYTDTTIEISPEMQASSTQPTDPGRPAAGWQRRTEPRSWHNRSCPGPRRPPR